MKRTEFDDRHDTPPEEHPAASLASLDALSASRESLENVERTQSTKVFAFDSYPQELLAQLTEKEDILFEHYNNLLRQELQLQNRIQTLHKMNISLSQFEKYENREYSPSQFLEAKQILFEIKEHLHDEQRFHQQLEKCLEQASQRMRDID